MTSFLTHLCCHKFNLLRLTPLYFVSQNLKKSWHPHTLKNQERVWKAEQQKAEEDRKMAELQRELKEEREREMLRKTAEDSGAVEKKSDAKLDWMYKVSCYDTVGLENL